TRAPEFVVMMFFEVVRRGAGVVSLLPILALAGCDAGAVESSGTPIVEIHSPGAEVVVGTSEGQGTITVAGEVTAIRELEGIAVSVNGLERELLPLDGKRAPFEVELAGLAPGEHLVTLVARDEEGRAGPDVSIRVEVGPPVREIPLPLGAY